MRAGKTQHYANMALPGMKSESRIAIRGTGDAWKCSGTVTHDRPFLDAARHHLLLSQLLVMFFFLSLSLHRAPHVLACARASSSSLLHAGEDVVAGFQMGHYIMWLHHISSVSALRKRGCLHFASRVRQSSGRQILLV